MLNYVVVDRNDLHELRRLVERAVRSSEDTRFITEVDDFLKDLDVLKLDAIVNQEIQHGHLDVSVSVAD